MLYAITPSRFEQEPYTSFAVLDTDDLSVEVVDVKTLSKLKRGNVVQINNLYMNADLLLCWGAYMYDMVTDYKVISKDRLVSYGRRKLYIGDRYIDMSVRDKKFKVNDFSFDVNVVFPYVKNGVAYYYRLGNYLIVKYHVDIGMQCLITLILETDGTVVSILPDTLLCDKEFIFKDELFVTKYKALNRGY